MKRSPLNRGSKPLARKAPMTRRPAKRRPSDLGRTPADLGRAVPQRKRGLRPVNPQRRQLERARAYGPTARRAWMKEQPCLVCHATPSDGHHVEGGGMGRKADASKQVPLCRIHHDECHATGARTFAARYGLDLQAEAAAAEARWQDALAHWKP